MMRTTRLFIFLTVVFFSCESEQVFHRREVQIYLDEYNKKYHELFTHSVEAQWLVNTHIVDGDTMNAYRSVQADQQLARFTGSEDNIERSKSYLKWKSDLTPLQVRQLEKIKYLAAGNPVSSDSLVKELLEATTQQTEKLYKYPFMLNGKEVTPNEIDSILSHSINPAERILAWESSKAIGGSLKEGLINLRHLRNEVVKDLGYSDYFSYMVSDYGMTSKEMMALLDKILTQVQPLYRELHTYMRYEVAAKYHLKEVPDYLPAHLLTNRWGQDWSEMADVPGFNIDSALGKKSSEWIAKQGEVFYTSLGFPELPETFWKRSSLYPVPKNAGYKKNTHATAWHVDLDRDVRSLMSITPTAHWYETVHHEYGHIYYYLSYSRDSIPYVLREGANRAFHEALGSMMGLAAMQKPFLSGIGLIDSTAESDQMKQLLKDALSYIVFIPWSAGTMSHFEEAMYVDNLAPEKWNEEWWKMTKKYQGIIPPSSRDSTGCDPATKTHINDDPAAYYDYALSYLLIFQFHNYISKNILHQDVHATNYFGNRNAGKYIEEIMRPGGTVQWQTLLRDKTGSDLSADAMLEYFAPLMNWLKEKNKGRTPTI